MKASEILGVPYPTLSDVLNGHISLSSEMAQRLEKAIGVGMYMLP